jgi:hypothetical protein
MSFSQLYVAEDSDLLPFPLLTLPNWLPMDCVVLLLVAETPKAFIIVCCPRVSCFKLSHINDV